MRGARLPVWVCCLAGIAGPALACDPDLTGAGVKILESPRYSLAFRPVPAPIVAGAHFALEMAVCAKPGAAPPDRVTVDANMPAHRHGMNYAARVSRAGDRRFRAEGLMLHMPGQWEFVFEVGPAGATERLTARHDLD